MRKLWDLLYGYYHKKRYPEPTWPQPHRYYYDEIVIGKRRKQVVMYRCHHCEAVVSDHEEHTKFHYWNHSFTPHTLDNMRPRIPHRYTYLDRIVYTVRGQVEVKTETSYRGGVY